MTTVKQIYDYLNKIAPFDKAMKADNCGVLIGDNDAEVKRVLLCLDATNKVIDEAITKKADLIIAHHPLMFFGVSKLCKSDPEYRLIAAGINMIAAHTNLDVAKGGITDLMLTKLGYPPGNEVIGSCKSGDPEFGKITELPQAITAAELAHECQNAFGCKVVRYVKGDKPIRRIGVCSGAGNDLVELALQKGCDAYICGDLRNDRFVFAANYGLTLVDAGHFHTENIFCDDLAARLTKAFPKAQFRKSANSVDPCRYVI
ncbi:MAG: Nif3-like dinuclear metal center hexameric protein [Oscillospiraceae bacterium]|nr:Nif3-like dinuclear metal center hexameric protein [Oscillospiraceae bacterium]